MLDRQLGMVPVGPMSFRFSAAALRSAETPEHIGSQVRGEPLHPRGGSRGREAHGSTRVEQLVGRAWLMIERPFPARSISFIIRYHPGS